MRRFGGGGRGWYFFTRVDAIISRVLFHKVRFSVNGMAIVDHDLKKFHGYKSGALVVEFQKCFGQYVRERDDIFCSRSPILGFSLHEILPWKKN
jgi:hypothetical protein